jgi:hypothetical protein
MVLKIPQVYFASRDSFQQAAAFNWGQASRFRIRGLDNENG